jgi:hypothetical protein
MAGACRRAVRPERLHEVAAMLSVDPYIQGAVGVTGFVLVTLALWVPLARWAGSKGRGDPDAPGRKADPDRGRRPGGAGRGSPLP